MDIFTFILTLSAMLLIFLYAMTRLLRNTETEKITRITNGLSNMLSVLPWLRYGSDFFKACAGLFSRKETSSPKKLEREKDDEEQKAA
jgi:hypothetical protein